MISIRFLADFFVRRERRGGDTACSVLRPFGDGAATWEGERVSVATHQSRSPMPTVFVAHDVKDKDHWLSTTTREDFFGPLGVTNIREFVNPSEPTKVGVLMDVADLDALLAALQTPEAREAEEADGVLAETITFLVEA
jgi:hypothetical protein